MASTFNMQPANLMDRYARAVRTAWLEWAKEQPDQEQHSSWLLPWEKLNERDRDVDRRIADAVIQAWLEDQEE